MRNYPSVAQIQDSAEVYFVDLTSFVPSEFSYISDPLLIRIVCMELAVQYILRCDLRILLALRASFTIVLNSGLYLEFSADASHPLVRNIHLILPMQFISESAVSHIRMLTVQPHSLIRDVCVFCSTLAWRSMQPAIICGT